MCTSDPCRERAEKAEAEVERLKSGFQGSCYCCEPVGILNQKLEAEVERLREQLQLAVILAEKLSDEWVDPAYFDVVEAPDFISIRSKIEQIKETFNPNDK